ncbi:MAG TPA: outer membrane beta-barrel protein [Gemmatimonadaceae bacterium]
MQRLVRVAMAAMLGVALSSPLDAQARSSNALTAAKPALQGGGGAPMTFTLMGGIATGESGLDLGLALSGSFEWDVREWPVNLRVDPYLARHSGDCGPFDCDLTLLGAGVGVAYHFPAAANAPLWYIFGGLGLYHMSTDVDDDGFPGGAGADGSDTDLGLQIGGGFRFGEGRYRLELRFLSVNSFDTIPILFGITF